MLTHHQRGVSRMTITFREPSCFAAILYLEAQYPGVRSQPAEFGLEGKVKYRTLILSLAVAGFLATAPGVLLGAGQPLSSVEQKVRHELITLPSYDVFDNLSFQANGGKITLLGEVRRTSLKVDADWALKRIERVTAVRNQIEVSANNRDMPARSAFVLEVARAVK